MGSKDSRAFQEAVLKIIELIGEDPNREGLRDTPIRVYRMWQELTVGYRQDPLSIVKSAVFESDYNEMVLIKDIEFYSLCEHHLLPFFGSAHVAYIPNGRIIGLSKISRLVDVYARRLQVQERLTMQIAQTLFTGIQPHGVGVVVEGLHLCSIMRGVRKQNNLMVTSAMLGVFKKDLKTRMEFLRLIGKGRDLR